MVDGGVVSKVLRVSGSDDVVVLLDPDRRPEGVLDWHPFHNVLRVTPTDEIRWRAELVPSETAAKCWLGIEWGTSLRAWTYSYECVLDAETGKITRSTFTK
jgi:hypothetical protein